MVYVVTCQTPKQDTNIQYKWSTIKKKAMTKADPSICQVARSSGV